MTHASKYVLHLSVLANDPDRLVAQHGRPGQTYEQVLRNVLMEHVVNSPHNDLFVVTEAQIEPSDAPAIGRT